MGGGVGRVGRAVLVRVFATANLRSEKLAYVGDVGSFAQELIASLRAEECWRVVSELLRVQLHIKSSVTEH